MYWTSGRKGAWLQTIGLQVFEYHRRWGFICSSRYISGITGGKISLHKEFFFDYEGNEDVKELLKKSILGGFNEVIVTYCQENIVVSIDSQIFFTEWEEIFASTLYNALFFSPDYKLIMEITRDYYLHSNFPIKK